MIYEYMIIGCLLNILVGFMPEAIEANLQTSQQ